MEAERTKTNHTGETCGRGGGASPRNGRVSAGRPVCASSACWRAAASWAGRASRG